MKCPECNGKCYNKNKYPTLCKFCKGKKELNWIDCIIGVDRNELTNSEEYNNIDLVNDNWYTYDEMSKM